MPNSPVFIHLHLHSEYSITDGIVRLDDAVSQAKNDAMPALALTDLSNVFGLVKFYKAARGAGIKPIVGCDVWLTNPINRDQPHRLILLCRSRAGYLALCELLTRAFRSNQYRGRAEIRREWFEEFGSAGLIALSGAQRGDIGQALAQGNEKLARELARQWVSIFPNAYYLELQRIGIPGEDSYIDCALDLASELQIPVVATHPVQFMSRTDFRAHEARVCISQGYVLGDRRRKKEFTEEQYFKTQAEMAALFADIPEALANSVEIARRCNLELELGKNRLPNYPTPPGVTLDDYLVDQAKSGLEIRLKQLFVDEAVRNAKRAEYEARLEFETKTIIQMGFPGYFLIVADFINWAKQNDVPVGPGRGSGAGSLVAYSLAITDLDPLRYDLLFERFLNPERVSMPDFDIDFCQDGRDRVIDYVKQKYGAESVSQIATFGTMAAKAVVRDVGRVMEWGYNRTDELAKLIPFQPGKLVTLAMAREMEPRLKEREETEDETRELLELAEQLEGMTRNVGMHAGGVLIAPGKLTDFTPLYVAEGADSMVSQFDKDDVEAVGLVKFDFLGLTTLTILNWAVRYIRRVRPDGNSFNLETIPLDNKETYHRIFASANVVAVFQFESRGMRDMLKQAKPDRFEDIIALVALYRPGPMDLIPDFVARKHGKEKVEYLDPRLQPILGPTYGVMVYQEQVMQIAQVIGGYSLGGADLLRRAMGKKKPEEMAQQRGIFVKGAVELGMAEGGANEVFNQMEKFAGYGFNKSHAAAYALVAYQTAYLKAHYPAEFMAATLSAVMADTDKVQLFYDDVAHTLGLVVLPPDVNHSEYRFVPVSTKEIRFGLGAIKGSGEAAIVNMVEARKSAPFIDLFDFCRRVDKRIVNRRTIESLIRAGAFDALNNHRASLLASVGVALEAAEQASRSASQVSLFCETEETSDSAIATVDARRWKKRELLQNEKLALGFYLSGHPFESYVGEVSAFVRNRLKDLQPQREREPVLIAGIVHTIRVQQTKRGRMAFITMDDGTAQVEVAVFNELFTEHRAIIKEDELLIIEGQIRKDEYTGGIRVGVDKIFDLTTARGRFARSLKLSFNGQANAERLAEVLKPYVGGTCPVRISYRNHTAVCDLELPESKRVRLSDTLIDSLVDWLTQENVQVVY
ncbi:MAG: DNA polymerase III subunit alpha [Pseudomonadota bacterium]